LQNQPYKILLIKVVVAQKIRTPINLIIYLQQNDMISKKKISYYKDMTKKKRHPPSRPPAAKQGDNVGCIRN